MSNRDIEPLLRSLRSLRPSSPPTPSAPSLTKFDADILHLRITGERFESLLAAVPALLVAAEWQLHAAPGAVRVHEHLPGLDPRRHGERLVDVASPHPGHESVLRPVGDRNRLVHIVEGHDGQDWPENLLLRDPHLG